MIRISEAAKIIGVNPETLRRWDRKGTFPAKWFFKQRRYNVEDCKFVAMQRELTNSIIIPTNATSSLLTAGDKITMDSLIKANAELNALKPPYEKMEVSKKVYKELSKHFTESNGTPIYGLKVFIRPHLRKVRLYTKSAIDKPYPTALDEFIESELKHE